MPDSTSNGPEKLRRHEVINSDRRPSQAEGEDPDDAGGHEVLDPIGRPSQAEGEDDD